MNQWTLQSSHKHIKTALSGKNTKGQSSWLSSLRPCYSGWARFLSFPMQLELLKQEMTRRFSAGYLYTPCMTHNNDQHHFHLMFDSANSSLHANKPSHGELLICHQSCTSLKWTEAIRMLTFRNRHPCSLIIIKTHSAKQVRAWLVVRVLKKSLPQTAIKVRQSWINLVYFLTSIGHKCFRRRHWNIIRRWKKCSLRIFWLGVNLSSFNNPVQQQASIVRWEIAGQNVLYWKIYRNTNMTASSYQTIPCLYLLELLPKQHFYPIYWKL